MEWHLRQRKVTFVKSQLGHTVERLSQELVASRKL